jgi:NAD+ synthase
MPINSSKDDFDCASELIKTNELKSVTVDLKATFDQFSETINGVTKPSDLSIANSKARLRMTTLYTLAQTNNYLVLGTDNLNE